jgi:hypothetical protein
MAVEKPHSQERCGVGGIDRDPARTAIPQDKSLMDIKSHRAAITQDSATVPSEGKVEGRDEVWGQGEIAVKPGIDDGLNDPFSTLKIPHGKTHDRLAIRTDPARDHARLRPLSS